MTERLARDERGVALGLAVILVALVGVMAAGLLTFVASDLDALVEVNRGQRAFELAEAGIEVAKAHLDDDPSPSDWSSGELHLEDVGENAVTVTVEHDDEEASFKATSTGEYGGTKRRIEAVFSIESGGPELVSWRELYE
jgi:type II secretory pathway component PulK